MNFEVSILAPRGADEGVDLETLKEQIALELQALSPDVKQTTKPAESDHLGEFMIAQYVVEHWDKIAAGVTVAAKTISALVGLNQTVRSTITGEKPGTAIGKKSESEKENDHVEPSVEVTVRNDGGKVVLTRKLPLSNDELKELQAELERLTVPKTTKA